MNTGRALPAGQAIVLYDGECPLCRKSVAILKRLDWLHRLNYHNARDVENLPETPAPLNPERLLEEMHLLTPDRARVYAGFRAFRWMAGRLPLCSAIWPLLFLPGASWIGQRLYLLVARHRYDLVPCRHGQCALPSRVKQPDDLARTKSS